MTNPQLLQKTEALLREFANMNQPKFSNEGPVDTTLDVITNLKLSITQRMIMLHLIFSEKTENAIQQAHICKALGLSNKCVRDNLITLHDAGYVHRGSKYNTWIL